MAEPSTNESILQSIKKKLGLSADCTDFDLDIIMDINSVLAVLTQIGIGPASGYQIESAEDTWSDYLDDYSKVAFVKTYIYAKVRLLFDPPTNGTTMDALKEVIREFECRLNYESDNVNKEENQNG